MPLHDIFNFRRLARALRFNPVNERPIPLELTRELDDLRKVLLNLLTAFLTVHASSVMGAVTLALLVYTINLHIVINASFLQNSPTLSRILHAIPVLGIFCMATFELVVVVQSPPVAAAVLLACALPPLVIAAHLGRRYAETIFIPFPVQTRDVAPAVSGPADETVELGTAK
ncbi:hypothetical protein JVU11DRAFT_4463 [Chiua virens]|nr:hypothetical protein JVU11DRAFT_4463 [Chiua virens]